MNKMRAVVWASLVTAVVLVSALLGWTQGSDGAPVVMQDWSHDTSLPMRDYPTSVMAPGPHMVLPRRNPVAPHVGLRPDTVLQGSKPLQRISVGTTPGLNFDGVNARDGVAPPDTNAAVGSTQVVETVNLSYQVYNKTTGASVFGPAEIAAIFTKLPGGCSTGPNFSDPVVLWDGAASRWVISILAFNNNFTQNDECVAVSTTSDATGSYNRYDFNFGSNLPDYQKTGVWPDAYYLSANIFPLGGAFIGPQACALDRSNMLLGNAATMQCFQRGTGDGSLLPSHLDGATAPPAGSPNFFIELGTSTTLNLFKFHVDFSNPSNSTFTGPTAITVSSYTDACAITGTCIPQKGTTQQLDSLGDRLMHRLAYRNLGDHESIVASHSIVAGSSTGVRWYEIRSPNVIPTLYQSGTFAPDANFRWMPSIAMDKAGDVAVGYSVSSSTMFPSISYTGRLATDALGTMESEASLLTGTGSQTGGLSRWGDYSSMAIDPSDDCTFWYANEYIPANGSFWHTRLASFVFPSCVSTAPDFTISATPSSQTVVQGNPTTYTATIAALNGFAGTVTFSASGLPSGASASFNPASVTTSGSSTMTVTTATTTPTGTYTITITGTSGATSHSTTVTLVVTSSATPDFSISATPPSLTLKRGNRGSYKVTITALNGFSGTVTFSVGGLPAHTLFRFTPTSVAGHGSTTLTVLPQSSATPGTYTLTITGTSGSLVHQTTVTLIVQ